MSRRWAGGIIATGAPDIRVLYGWLALGSSEGTRNTTALRRKQRNYLEVGGASGLGRWDVREVTRRNNLPQDEGVLCIFDLPITALGRPGNISTARKQSQPGCAVPDRQSTDSQDNHPDAPRCSSTHHTPKPHHEKDRDQTQIQRSPKSWTISLSGQGYLITCENQQGG